MRERIIQLSGTATIATPMAFQSSNAAAPLAGSGTSGATIPAVGVPQQDPTARRTLRVIEGTLFTLNPGSPPDSSAPRA